ncbi:SagB-type dehydrogenase domain-containing protein [Amycolatopsis xylanica]|uniref:SagB-type dehydrogenase domain-containing protein n=1 Tax=Amycolatopsis xylanica TaxID=589385 RepID=A0A1H3PKB7_9PSEU|nr:SagB family peptide dehydrogenase [Amycolatopsis xylanica]SDZ01480.1 SagB-type dehydrogenase domain-containing protein [Amycolatopsis xylanica]
MIRNTESYRLRSDATLTTTPDGQVVLEQSRFRLRPGGLDVSRRALLLRLSETWVSDLDVARLITGFDGESKILPAQLLIRRLMSHSWLQRRISFGGRPLIDISPRGVGAGGTRTRRAHVAATPYRLSRFAVMRGEGGRMIVHSPLSNIQISCVQAELGALLVLAATGGCTVADIAKRADTDLLTAGLLLDELLTAGVLVSHDESEAETTAAPMALWSPEELWLHDRTRPMNHADPIGGTYRFRGVIEPEPLAYRLPRAGAPIALPEPQHGQDSLQELASRRKSVRRHDDANPITAAELAEFLYRVQHLEPAGEQAGEMETGKRPYPGAGSIAELEIYPLISRCDGLEPGLYHYDSVRHALELVSAHNAETAKLASFATAASVMPSPPQVLFVITARVQRLMWKYEGIPYALALKDAGVLTGWMYLVATAMGLAPCALGAGDSATFTALSGLDPLREPSIAEFTLGSLPPATEED